MDNFEVLNHYSIPSDILMDMLETYRLIGETTNCEEILGDRGPFIKKSALTKDVYYLAKFLPVANISQFRMQQLIEKDATPKNKEEQMVARTKQILLRLDQNADANYPFNGSDILDAINTIVGKRVVTFSKEVLPSKRKVDQISIRLLYERMLEKYHLFLTQKRFEAIFLSVICYMEIVNLKPYTDFNNLGAILALYYMLRLVKLNVFKYVSFMALFDKVKEEVEDTVLKGSINFADNYLQVADTARLIFKLIHNAYHELNSIIKDCYYKSRAFKSDVIEETIKNLPIYFTKDDIRRAHPEASDSTINRTLFKLRDLNQITPLGKGRNAIWHKNPEYSDNQFVDSAIISDRLKKETNND